MELKAREVKIVNLLNEYECDKCKLGRMVFSPESCNGMYLDKQVVFYRHVCSKCGVEGYLNKKYPFLSSVYNR